MRLKPEMTGDLVVPMPLMQVLSINVGHPREIMWRGQRVITSIYKEPVAGPIRLDPYNLAGDQQADLNVHGGPDKVVYAYPAVYYSEWAHELPGIDLPWGMFGENLTLSGVTDQTVYIGDRYQIGSAEVIVTQPRLPCYKLGIRFGRDSFVKQFLKSRRTGFYFALVRSGEIAAGDAALLLARDTQPLSVADVVRLYAEDRDDIDGLRRAVAVAALPTAWRDTFQARLERLQT